MMMMAMMVTVMMIVTVYDGDNIWDVDDDDGV